MRTGTPEMGQSAARSDDELMSGWTAQVMCVTIRGIIACFPQQRIEKMLILISAVMGQQVAQAYANDELSVHKLRKMCRESFDTGIKSVPVTTLSGPKATDTASISGA